MPRWLQIILHLSMVGAGSYAAYASGSPLPLVISSGAQTALGGIAQLYNTDGTPQSVPYSKPETKP